MDNIKRQFGSTTISAKAWADDPNDPTHYTSVLVTMVMDMSGLEKSLHRMFKKKRVNGEWFDLADDDVMHFKSIGTDARVAIEVT